MIRAWQVPHIVAASLTVGGLAIWLAFALVDIFVGVRGSTPLVAWLLGASGAMFLVGIVGELWLESAERNEALRQVTR